MAAKPATVHMNNNIVVMNGDITDPDKPRKIGIKGASPPMDKPKPLEAGSRVLKQKGKQDLLAIYEDLNSSYEDLTFKEFCSPLHRSKKQVESSTDVSLDFMTGLAAVGVDLPSVAEEVNFTRDSKASFGQKDGQKRNGSSGGYIVSSMDGIVTMEIMEDVPLKVEGSMGDVLKHSIRNPSSVKHTVMSRESSTNDHQQGIAARESEYQPSDNSVCKHYCCCFAWIC